MKYVSKIVFLNTLFCPTLGWMTRARLLEKKKREITLGDRFRMEQGLYIGKKARNLYPEGILVETADFKSAVEHTNTLMKELKVNTIYEGSFLADNFATKADILKRAGKQWQILEVKSSMTMKKDYIDDMAYTTMVIDKCGIDISNISIVLISKDYRLGMEDKMLFVEVNYSDEVMERVEFFKQCCDSLDVMTRASKIPEPVYKSNCKRCPAFKDCLGKDTDNPVFDIPRLSDTKFDKLKENRILRIEDIPEDFPLTKNQKRVADSVKTGKEFIGKKLKGELNRIVWPAFFLDFETVQTAKPLYPEVAPFTQLPTQYSIHKCSEPGMVIDHFEYLADPVRDCRQELSERLVNDLEGEGSIISYGNFEKQIINNLAKLFPDLAEKLLSLIDRFINLERIININYYHKDFHGKTSVKITQPVLAPELSYDDLDINEGSTAIAAFAYLALGKFNDEEADKMRKNLLDYCRQDTLAMVKLHERLLYIQKSDPIE